MDLSKKFSLTPAKKKRVQYHFLRWVTTLWNVILFALIILDFAHDNAYTELVEPIAILYIGTLALYSVEKEFERWYEYHIGRHPGEVYVVAWTALLVGIIGARLILHNEYHIPSEVISTYIGVLGLLAITKKSKEFYKELHKEQNEK